MPWREVSGGYTKKTKSGRGGGFVKNPAQYEKLKAKYGKERAAKITNASKSFAKASEWKPSKKEKAGFAGGVAGAGTAAAGHQAHSWSKQIPPLVDALWRSGEMPKAKAEQALPFVPKLRRGGKAAMVGGGALAAAGAGTVAHQQYKRFHPEKYKRNQSGGFAKAFGGPREKDLYSRDELASRKSRQKRGSRLRSAGALGMLTGAQLGMSSALNLETASRLGHGAREHTAAGVAEEAKNRPFTTTVRRERPEAPASKPVKPGTAMQRYHYVAGARDSTKRANAQSAAKHYAMGRAARSMGRAHLSRAGAEAAGATGLMAGGLAMSELGRRHQKALKQDFKARRAQFGKSLEMIYTGSLLQSEADLDRQEISKLKHGKRGPVQYIAEPKTGNVYAHQDTHEKARRRVRSAAAGGALGGALGAGAGAAINPSARGLSALSGGMSGAALGAVIGSNSRARKQITSSPHFNAFTGETHGNWHGTTGMSNPKRMDTKVRKAWGKRMRSSTEHLTGEATRAASAGSGAARSVQTAADEASTTIRQVRALLPKNRWAAAGTATGLAVAAGTPSGVGAYLGNRSRRPKANSVTKSYLPGKGFKAASSLTAAERSSIKAGHGFRQQKTIKDPILENYKTMRKMPEQETVRRGFTGGSKDKQKLSDMMSGSGLGGVTQRTGGKNTGTSHVKINRSIYAGMPKEQEARGLKHVVTHEQMHAAPKRSEYRLHGQILSDPYKHGKEEARADYLTAGHYKKSNYRNPPSGYPRLAAQQRTMHNLYHSKLMPKAGRQGYEDALRETGRFNTERGFGHGYKDMMNELGRKKVPHAQDYYSRPNAALYNNRGKIAAGVAAGGGTAGVIHRQKTKPVAKAFPVPPKPRQPGQAMTVGGTAGVVGGMGGMVGGGAAIGAGRAIQRSGNAAAGIAQTQGRQARTDVKAGHSALNTALKPQKVASRVPGSARTKPPTNLSGIGENIVNAEQRVKQASSGINRAQKTVQRGARIGMAGKIGAGLGMAGLGSAMAFGRKKQ